MTTIISPSNVRGRLQAPASKSFAQRAVAAALLARGTSRLTGLTLCDDTEAAMRVAEALGATLHLDGRTLQIAGGLTPRSDTLTCGEAGLCIRMFTPIAAMADRPLTLTGHGSLVTRPLDFLQQPLTQLGASFESTDGCLPLTVCGPLTGGRAAIDGSLSSQFITGLLMACPLAARDTLLTVENPKSLPYLDMTLEVLRDFGIRVTHKDYCEFRIPGNQAYQPNAYDIEGDWSGAAFLLVAGAICGDITVEGLSPKSLQADRGILEALQSCGAKLKVGPDQISVGPGQLQAFSFDATHCPDLFPPLAALAVFCPGITRIKGVNRLKHKESDRATAIRNMFGKMGIELTLDGDMMLIHGGQPSGASVQSQGDHRMAMAAAVTALKASGPVEIDQPACVAKSYPGFFDDIAALGAFISTSD